MKQILLMVWLMVLLSIIQGCGNEQESTPPASTPTVEAPETAPSPGARQKALPNAEQQALIEIIEAYYRDLTAEQIDVSAYFTPVVSQFFNASDIAREQISQSLQQGFAQYESREITLDANSFAFVRLKDGMQVSFAGNSKTIMTGSGKEITGAFHNQVTFNEAGLITRYEAANAQQSKPNQKVGQDFVQFAQNLVRQLRSGSFEAAQSAVHPELGLFYLVKPGAISIPYPTTSLTKLTEPGPYRLNLSASFCEDMEVASLPTFTCGEPFAKQGCFVHSLSKPYQEITELMQAVNAGDAETYKANRMGQARELEQYISHGLVDTEAGMALYFGEVNGKWYLLVIDKATYDCGA